MGFIGAAREGLTLTESNTAVFAELDWVPGNVTQGEDDIHRIGQHGAVTIQHILLDGSLDAQMAQTLVAKQDLLDHRQHAQRNLGLPDGGARDDSHQEHDTGTNCGTGLICDTGRY